MVVSSKVNYLPRIGWQSRSQSSPAWLPDFPPKVQQFLNANPEMQGPFYTVYFEVIQKLNTFKVDYTSIVELVKDVEDPEREDLILRFEIEGKNYQEILALWDVLAKEAFNKIIEENPKLAGKIEIVLDEKKP